MVTMKIFLLLCYLLIPSIALASHATNLGDVAENLMQPVTMLAEFIYAACIIVGACALMGSFLRYMQYRVNPHATPISTVILLLIIGIVLICLPLVYKLTESGIPFHLF